AAEGFEQIIDFLSGSYIHYALTVSPPIYISCIKQFWNSASVKCSGDVTRLQALVDKKKIVIFEAVIREILQLNDAEGVSMEVLDSHYSLILSAKRTFWNEFNTAMASAVICLSKDRYISPDLTQKVFANMRRVGKGFSGVEMPLFESMLVVRDVAEEAEAQVSAQGDDVQEPTTEEVVPKVVPPTPTLPSSPSPIIPSLPPHQPPCPPQPQDAEVPSLLFQHVLDTCSALARKVEGLENDKAAQQLEIVKLKAMVKKLEKINMVKSFKLRQLKKENDAEVEGRHPDKQAELYNFDQDHSLKVLSMQEDDTESPHIYISCIKQFWNSVSVKRSGVVCLLNEEIFAGLAQMRYEKPSIKLTFYKAFFSNQWKFLIHTILQSLSAKRTSWNEFGTTMASALQILYVSSFYTTDYSKQVGDLSTHTTRFISPALTQKVFANMRRVGKGFSRVETPLFEGMIAARHPAEEELGAEQVQVDAAVDAAVIEDVAEDVVHMATPSPPPHGISSPPQEPSSLPHQPPCPPQSQDAEGSSLLFQQVLDTCSVLARRVEGLENDKAAQQLEIVKLKARVKKLENINMVKSSKLRWLKNVGTSQRVESSDDMENVFNQERIIVDMDQDEGIEMVLSIQEDDTEVQEAVEIVTTAKLMTEVVTAAATQVVAASTPIPAAKPKILNIVAAPPVSTKRRKGVVIKDPEEELPIDTPAETLKKSLWRGKLSTTSPWTKFEVGSRKPCTGRGNKNDDAHEHIKRVLDIVSVFNILGVTRDAVMLYVFLITLTGVVKRWVDRLTQEPLIPGISSKKPLFKGNAHHLRLLNNLKTFATSSKREKKHCTRLGKDSHGPIPGMTPAEGLAAIQTMADHSQKWHDGSPG
nr:hypothetical protein [Tanacetum cinerariifolium]